jgi:hypothetical protein
VYTWTDRRESALDKSWWKTAGTRFYRAPVQPAAARQPGMDLSVGVETPAAVEPNAIASRPQEPVQFSAG